MAQGDIVTVAELATQELRRLQPDLFPAPPRPLARATDPTTSHLAARFVARSGVLSTQLRETLTALAAEIVAGQRYPTSHEMAHGDAEKRYLYGRRLSDLEKLGYVEKHAQRRCRQTERQAVTWGLTAAGRGRL